MALLGFLNVALGLDASGLQKGSKKAKSTMGELKDSMSKVGDSINSTFSKFVGFEAAKAAIGGFSGMVKETFSSMADTGRVASSLGMSTEALTRMQHAARMTGVDTGLVTESMGKMASKVAQAAAGLGEAGPALQALGLDARQLKNASPEKQFMVIGEALKGIKNPGDQAAIAVKLFEESGIKMLPLLTQGIDGMKGLGDEADRLGISFSALDSAQVQVANAEMTKVQETLQGVANKVAVELAPYISALAENFSSWASDTVNNNGVVANSFGFVESAITKTATAMQNVKAGWKVAQSYVSWGIASLLSGLETFANKLVDLYNWAQEKMGGSKMEHFSLMGEMSKAVTELSEEQFADAGKVMGENWGQAARDAMEGIKKSAMAKAQDIAEKAQNLAGAGTKGDLSAMNQQAAKLETKFSSAMQFGSTEAYDALIRNAYSGRDSANAQTAANTKALVDKTTEQTGYMKEMVDLFGKFMGGSDQAGMDLMEYLL